MTSKVRYFLIFSLYVVFLDTEMEIKRGFSSSVVRLLCADLERCEAEAKAKQLGLFSSDAGATTVRNITWAVGDADFVSNFASKNLGKLLPAVVEYVRDGGSMRVAIRLSDEKESPPSYAYCALSLAGLQCPGTRRDAEGANVPEPFAGKMRSSSCIVLHNAFLSVVPACLVLFLMF